MWAQGIPHTRSTMFSVRSLRWGRWKQSRYPGIDAAFISNTGKLMETFFFLKKEIDATAIRCASLQWHHSQISQMYVKSVLQRKSAKTEHSHTHRSINLRPCGGKKKNDGRPSWADWYILWTRRCCYITVKTEVVNSDTGKEKSHTTTAKLEPKFCTSTTIYYITARPAYRSDPILVSFLQGRWFSAGPK